MAGDRRGQLSSSPASSPIYADIEDAICLLTLVSQRPKDLENVLDSNAKGSHGNTGTIDLGTRADRAQTSRIDGQRSQSDADDSDEEAEDEVERFHEIDLERDHEKYLEVLKNKVLDRLAEVLARFKSGRETKKPPDASHVASTMMVICHEPKSVKVFCAKNEGLDEKDKRFLRSWKDCMETIATKGAANEDDKDRMYDLVFNHQRPRITTYLQWLKQAFGREPTRSSQKHHHRSEAGLTESRIRSLPSLRQTIWVDHNQLEYIIPKVAELGRLEDASAAASTGESVKNTDTEVSRLFQHIQELCNDDARQPAVEDGRLKQLIRSAFELYGGVRSQSAIKGYLQRQLPEVGKRKQAEKALLFLRRVYCAVQVFINAAESSRYFETDNKPRRSDVPDVWD